MTSLGVTGCGHLRAYDGRLRARIEGPAGRLAARACILTGAHLPEQDRFRNQPHAHEPT